MSLSFRSVAYGLLACLVGAGLIVLIGQPFFVSTDLRSNLWAPAYLLVHGQNPYDTTVLMAEHRWLNPVWFPMIIGLLFPLGWLTVYQATNLWLLLSLAVIVTMLWWAAFPRRPSLPWFALCLLAILLFPPTIGHLRLGQLSLLIGGLFWFAARQIDRRWPLAALVTAVALSKPQLGVLAVSGLLWWVYRRTGWKASARLLGGIGLICLLLTVPLFCADAGWPARFVQGLRGNPPWRHPSLFYLLRIHWGGWGVMLWGCAALSGLVANLWLWTRLPAERAMLWSLAWTPLLTPYVWSWDFVLLIPLILWLFFHSRRARWFIGGGYLACWVLLLRLNPNMGSDKTWWVPWLLFVFICIGFMVDKKLWTDQLA